MADLQFGFCFCKGDHQNIVDFWNYFLLQYGNELYQKAQNSIRRTILHTLLLLEASDRLMSHNTVKVLTDWKFNINQLLRFHLLAFDVILNKSNLQTMIVNVSMSNQLIFL